MITHYDLFAGIGGFSLALEEIFTDDSIRHIFCEWESFPTSVLRQHWPDGEFYGDISELVTHTDKQRSLEGRTEINTAKIGQSAQSRSTVGATHVTNTKHKGLEGRDQKGARHDGFIDRERTDKTQDWAIVTGGFPCQPFSHAGRRKGTADDRYQWPNMFAVIRNTKPEWVIAENVRGLVTWNEGMVLETVCADLEAEGYEVQPFIIPAVAVGAPHRRDRVWIIAHAERNGQPTAKERRSPDAPAQQQPTRQDNAKYATGADSLRPDDGRSERTPNANSRSQRRGKRGGEDIRPPRLQPEQSHRQYPDWSRNWQEVAFATCDDAVDDGLPRLVDGIPQSRSKWRQNSLKAYGNGIVSQVAMEIMKAIKDSM